MGDTMVLQTSVMDREITKRLGESERAYREFRKDYARWAEALKNKDVAAASALARERDAKARRASRAFHEADRFVRGLTSLWELAN